MQSSVQAASLKFKEQNEMAITLKRNGSRIEFIAPSGAVVAFLVDGSDEITYDPLADTEEMLGHINYRDVIAEAGLSDAQTARSLSEI